MFNGISEIKSFLSVSKTILIASRYLIASYRASLGFGAM
jgi:hypothetical protein